MNNKPKPASNFLDTEQVGAIAVCALYKFCTLEDYQDLKDPFLAELNKNEIRGTLLLAAEGINGTIAGEAKAMSRFLNWMQQDSRLAEFDYKVSWHDTPPFHRTKVKLKKEIVTMGVEGIDPNQVVGTYVEPKEWNEIISDPETVLIDTRNAYEVEIGTFKNAIDPKTETFREFPDYVKKNFDTQKHKKVAMFCTGGIRCEKASAYMKEQGFEEVFHLKGGILRYLEEVEQNESLWEGECFVFDDRVAVNHGLDKGSYDQCHACRYPITEEDKQSQHFVQGVSCPRCFEKLSEEQKQRFSEREKQVQLAKARGQQHIGSGSLCAAQENKELKEQRKQENPNKATAEISASA